MLVSNDTGPMHLGAAAGAPTLGLFCSRYGMQHIYAPLGPHGRAVAAEDLAELDTDAVYSIAAETLQASANSRATNPAAGR